MISIIAPTSLRSGGGIWSGSSWTELDADRIDHSINSDVKTYNLTDYLTQLDQNKATAHQLMITGHITADSELIGTGVFEKAKNLVLAGRQWYFSLIYGSSGFPQVKLDNTTWDFLFQKIMILDVGDSGDEIMNYQIGLTLAHL